MAKRWARVMVGGLAVLAAAFSAPADARSVDIELVIAVDSSTSVDFDEFNLQVRGLAAAFRDPTVVAAIACSLCGFLLVMVISFLDLAHRHSAPAAEVSMRCSSPLFHRPFTCLPPSGTLNDFGSSEGAFEGCRGALGH